MAPFAAAADAPRPARAAEPLPPRAERENRTALFPLWLAAVSGAAWLALEASRWTAASFSASGGEPTAALAALGIAAATTLAISGAFVLNAAFEAATYGLMLWKGRKITDEQFRAFLRAEVLEGRLDANAAALIKPYRPDGWNGMAFAFAARGSIWVRPELLAFPAFLRLTLLHELSHVKRGGTRGPPRGALRRVIHSFFSEIRARASELRGPGALKTIKIPALERALRQAQISLKLASAFDVLVLNPGAAELRDPTLYAGLSDGAARVTPVESRDPAQALAQADERRFHAVVLGGASALLPTAESMDGRRLEAALQQLDSLYLLSTRLVARGGASFAADSAEAKGWSELVNKAERLRRKGSRKALAAFESDVRRLWHQIASSRLKGMQIAGVTEGLYRSLADRGMAFVSFGPRDAGVAVWERLLRYWESPDGGQLKVTRVDLEDGGHVLVVRKVEARVGLWLRPVSGGRIETSVANADRTPQGVEKARAALTQAGFGAQLPLFDEMGVSVRHVFAADLGRQEIYVTVPRRNAAAIRKFVSSESVTISASKQDFYPHLMDSAGPQGVKPVWQAGFTGAAGTILWVDTGGDTTHEDFLGRLDTVDMVNEGPEDWHGHGTHVAGISIADRSPFIGMAPKAEGVMVKVFSRETPGASDGDIMGSAVIARERGADVVSLSLGSRGSSADNLAEFFSQLTRQKMSNGEYPIVTASAGNSGPFDRTLSQPSAGAEVIAVAAAAKSLDDGRPEISFFSSVGPDTDRRYAIRRLRLKPELTALGGDILTAAGQAAIYLHGIFSSKSKDSPRSASDHEDGKHTGLSGTSMSNPMVAGIALLVKQAMKATGAMTPFVAENLPFAMKAVLMRTARDMGAPVWFQGAGLVDAWAAVKLVASASGARLGRGLRRLLAREPAAPAEGWDWLERLKAVNDAEEEAFKAAELAKSEALVQLDESGEDDADMPPEDRAALTNAAQGEAQRRFNAARDAVLPKVVAALKDPVWLVRHQAAFVLLNFRVAAAALPLAEAALNDADPRVRRMAFLALAETPTHTVDVLLAKAAEREAWDVGAYAAYALARRGDRGSIARAIKELGSADKSARFSAAWLLGQLQAQVGAKEAEALSARVKDGAERGNVRHLAAASLGNIASAAPEAVSDQVVMDLLEAAGPDNIALTRTIQKFFPIALRDKTFVARLRQEPLKAIVTGFVIRNKDAILKPGALSELVQQLARVVNVPLDAPTALADPAGIGVAGVDPAAGPIDLILLPPSGAAADASAIDPSFLRRFEATLRAPLGRSGLLWVSVPEHKLYAFTIALQHYGFGVRASLPLYPLASGAAGAGTVLDLVDGESPVSLPKTADLSLVKVRASAGVSEARVMAALEGLADMAEGKGPVVVSLALSAPARRRSALTVLVDRLVASGLGVVVPAGDSGPRAGSLTAPGDSALAVTVAAASGDREPAFYSARGTAERPVITWTDLVDELLPDAPPAEGAVLGTGAAAERTAEKLAALTRTLVEGLALRSAPVPAGWFQLVVAHAARHLKPMPASRPHEVGGGLFTDLAGALTSLEARLDDPAALAREAEGYAQKLRPALEPAAVEPEPGFWGNLWSALRARLPGFKPAEAAARTLAAFAAEEPAAAAAGARARRAWLKDYKRVLMDGVDAEDGRRVTAFRFKSGSSWYTARSAGLEGFLYSLRELAANGVDTKAQLNDQFAYVDALLSGSRVMDAWRARFADLRTEALPLDLKAARFDALLAEAVGNLRARVSSFDDASWGRRNSTYMIFARAYNRLKPGKNFFDSLDEAELARLKNDPAIRANELWLMDVFEIGEVNRWGTGGGSSYSIKGYILKKELGGEAAFKAFVARAHAAGLKVKLDFIPNHTSLDSEMIRRRPESFLHVVPPQHLSDDEIMAQVPRERSPHRAPIYRLVRTEAYPMPDGTRKPMRILVHHPRTDFGDVMWVDLAQIDYSQPAAREWQTAEMRRLFEDLGVDSARRDMAYEILNARYPSRWLHILRDELNDVPAGWMRDAHAAMLAGFEKRWKALNGAEFFEEATDAVKERTGSAVMIDEAYAHADELSRSGSDGVYNKNDHDAARGQVGLYDAMQSRSASRIRDAMRHAAFRRWQRGGAPMVNFVGTHDGGEGNPVDKFGRLFKSAVLTAMLMRPILYYNGLEQGVGQRDNLIGDLSKSVDTAKAIPYDIPVLIDWTKSNDEHRAHLAKVLAVGEEAADTFDRGVMEVLTPNWDAPLVAWSQNDGINTFVMAANWSESRSGAQFRFDKAVLKGLGAFVPEAGKRYRFTDRLDESIVFERDGADLLANGLYVELPGAGTHLFKVETLSAPAARLAAPNEGPRPGEGLPAPPAKKAFAAQWDRWTQRLTDFAAVPFLALQAPQIWANLTNLLAGHPEQLANLPWMGYSTGILGNMLLLSWFASQKESSAARVQAIGVVTSAVVVAQIFMAGFMPATAFAAVMGAIVAGLVLNRLKFKDKAPAGLWSFWSKASSLLGLVVLPQVLWATFAPAALFSYWPGVVAGALGLAATYLDSKGRLPAPLKSLWSNLGAWTATLLFMYGPVAQLMSNLTNPAGMAGIAIGTLLLAMAGNLLMLPRAMHTKNLVWFTGSAWGVAMGGWAVLLTLFAAGFAAPWLFWSATAFIPLYLAASYLLSRASR
ncbi:MAG: S8 family serine peptidase [Elusimicrobiota bacterium]|nr:S8 family serine peptidase [Elusimicrobiota bacterium]